MKSLIAFLIRLPNKYLMLFLFLIVFPAYLYFRSDFLGQMADKLLIAILALLGTQKPFAEYFKPTEKKDE